MHGIVSVVRRLAYGRSAKKRRSTLSGYKGTVQPSFARHPIISFHRYLLFTAAIINASSTAHDETCKLSSNALFESVYGTMTKMSSRASVLRALLGFMNGRYRYTEDLLKLENASLFESSGASNLSRPIHLKLSPPQQVRTILRLFTPTKLLPTTSAEDSRTVSTLTFIQLLFSSLSSQFTASVRKYPSASQENTLNRSSCQHPATSIYIIISSENSG